MSRNQAANSRSNSVSATVILTNRTKLVLYVSRCVSADKWYADCNAAGAINAARRHQKPDICIWFHECFKLCAKHGCNVVCEESNRKPGPDAPLVALGNDELAKAALSNDKRRIPEGGMLRFIAHKQLYTLDRCVQRMDSDGGTYVLIFCPPSEQCNWGDHHCEGGPPKGHEMHVPDWRHLLHSDSDSDKSDSSEATQAKECTPALAAEPARPATKAEQQSAPASLESSRFVPLTSDNVVLTPVFVQQPQQTRLTFRQMLELKYFPNTRDEYYKRIRLKSLETVLNSIDTDSMYWRWFQQYGVEGGLQQVFAEQDRGMKLLASDKEMFDEIWSDLKRIAKVIEAVAGEK